jgi:hypothetical protein
MNVLSYAECVDSRKPSYFTLSGNSIASRRPSI